MSGSPSWIALGLALFLTASARAAGPDVPDPYYVFFSGAGCHSGILEVEVFDRGAGQWRPHPAHWRILADTCHREDAGGLLNEVRVRCFDREDPGRHGPWKVGFRLDELRDEAECLRERPQVVALRPADPRIRLVGPPPGEVLRNLTQRMDFSGRVDLDHDVVVLVDQRLFSGDARRERAVAALARWLESLTPNLGALRVAVLPFRSGEVNAAEVRVPPDEARATEIPYATEAGALRLALRDAVLPRAQPAPSLLGRLERLGDALRRPDTPERRRTLVVVADTQADVPFGPMAGAHPVYRRRLLTAFEAVLDASSGVRVQAILVGRPERALGELVDELRLRVGGAEERGAVRIVDDASRVEGGAPGTSPHVAEPITASRDRASLRAALAEVETVSLLELRAVNTTNGVLAEEIEFGRDGRFGGSVGLAVGDNRLRVEAVLSDHRSLEAEFEYAFDNAMIRDHYLEAERARMRAYRERNGIVTIDAEDR